ncbi:MAG: hypothetical protein UR27_C0002G0008 [Candidatus Peregrinibacteria bacterium GW2011_GWA2_33_10]|nr:MAG: hypothetical protein UR27_C0002G0008 [Candidatus Peregrinibacteria bacterium GW2011_GWA2_33_10]KKP41023.1 MAG: hypothetical protein UR30_C0002G0057 [Candidatus Peregrinibacteria bacterium GW2011_GWC2_33_13]
METHRILLLILLILLSGIFSASETALTSISMGRVHSLVKNKKRGAKKLEKLKSNPNRLLITILIGNNVVNILASVYASVFFTEMYGSAGPGIAAGMMTFLLLMFGEITPKSIAIRYSEGISLFISPFLLMLELLLFPIMWLLEHFLKMQKHIFGINHEKLITEDELIALASIGAEEGSIQRQEKELIENVLEFNDIEVKEIMTPRTEMDCLEEEATVREAAHFIADHTHTKIPVYRESIDNIVGLISVREILEYVAKGKMDIFLKDINLRKPYIIPNTKKINVLLQEFQRKRNNLAIIVDEHGGTAGLVTIEDILEEIVGEIIDEHDKEEELIKIIDKNTVVVQGKTPIYEVNESFGIELLMEDYKPISALILKKLKHIPKQGEKFQIDNLIFRVEKITRNKIDLVKIERQKI